jgi:hypothetical protein
LLYIEGLLINVFLMILTFIPYLDFMKLEFMVTLWAIYKGRWNKLYLKSYLVKLSYFFIVK